MQTPSVQRIMAILTKPKEVWPQIAGEATSVRALYLGWILWLAAIPPVFSSIGASLMWSRMMGPVTMLGMGGVGPFVIQNLIMGYILQIVLVAVLAWATMALAKSFDGQPDLAQATKTVAYAFTPVWLAGVFQALPVPFLDALVSLAAWVYAIYQLFLGLPLTMRCSTQKAGTYTAVIAIIGVLTAILLGMIKGGMWLASRAGTPF
jgi:hypothetical protein